MDALSEESKALYNILMADTKEEYESRFFEHKKEILDAVKIFVDDTGKKFRSVNSSIDAVAATVEGELADTREVLGAELASVRNTLSAEIAQLTATVDRVIRMPNSVMERTPAPHTKAPGDDTVGQFGHRWAQQHRGTACATHTPPPGGGTEIAPKSNPMINSSCDLSVTDASASAPRVELPQFDGNNSKLWQRRCEEYFQRWNTPRLLWISYASSLFVGAAATWLESYVQASPQADWSEFVAAVQARFTRNQHQLLCRKLFRICQTGTIEDYVQRFSELMDQISAYESRPDPIHYLTRFLDGLNPEVRVLVAIQQPRDLDTAYTLALLYEELGDGFTPVNIQHNPIHTPRRLTQHPQSLPPPQPPAKWISKSVEEKRLAETSKNSQDDRWMNLKAYRRSKGLCFLCGEKWGKEHQCKNTIQLHVVQEMLEMLQLSESDSEYCVVEEGHTESLMLLSAAACDQT